MDRSFKNTKTIQRNYNSDLLCDWDLVPSRSTLKLFQANTHLNDAQRDLIITQIYAQKQRMYNISDWQDLQASKAELRKQFRTINKTICDNKASKYRLNKKTKEFLGVESLIKEEIDNTELNIEKYSEIKERMEKHVTFYSELFTSYLETVAQKSPEFNSVQDILNRYEILENCRNECSQLLKKEMDGAVELRREMMKIVEEKSSRLKVLDNSLVMLAQRQRRAAEAHKKWNHVVINMEQAIANKLEESVTLKEGSYNLYRTICNKRTLKPIIAKEDTKNQMHCIKNTILFYKDVIHLAAELQQYQKQSVQIEDSVCRSSFVKRILDDLAKEPIEKTKKQ